MEVRWTSSLPRCQRRGSCGCSCISEVHVVMFAFLEVATGPVGSRVPDPALSSIGCSDIPEPRAATRKASVLNICK